MKRILCYLNKHDYYVIKEFDRCNRKLGCTNCSKTWGMNDRVKALVPWDGELEELYELFDPNLTQ